MNNVFKKAVTLLAVLAASLSTLEALTRSSRLEGRKVSTGGSAAGMNSQRDGGSYGKNHASSSDFNPAKVKTLNTKQQLASITAANVNGMDKETLQAFTGAKYGYLSNAARTAFRARAKAVSAQLKFNPATAATS